MNDWKKISSNSYGHVFEKNNIILKIIPQFQEKEIKFWKKINLKSHEKLFIIPKKILTKKITNNYLGLSNGLYYFIYMNKIGQTFNNYLSQYKLTNNIENKLCKQLNNIFTILHNQGFVHADVHFDNILKDKNKYYLIDFGLVMHKDFCQSKNELDIYKLYLWAKEDFYSLLLKLLFQNNQNLLIKNNNYSVVRQKWIKYFKKYSNKWYEIKDCMNKIFNFKNNDDYYYCFQFFINNILSNSKQLSPKPGIQFYDMLTKIYLDRIFLIISIYNPQIIKLNINENKQKFYKTILNLYFCSSSK